MTSGVVAMPSASAKQLDATHLSIMRLCTDQTGRLVVVASYVERA